jgi:hypothetical protein
MGTRAIAPSGLVVSLVAFDTVGAACCAKRRQFPSHYRQQHRERLTTFQPPRFFAWSTAHAPHVAGHVGSTAGGFP